jgi:putative membrane protein
MSPGAKSFLQRWFVTTLGVLAAATIVDGIHADSALGLLAASLLLGILNAFLRPALMLLALPLLIVTLGLFTLIINAVLLCLVGWLVSPFHVADFWSAFKGGLVISIVSLFANLLIGKEEARVQIRRDPQQNPPKSPDTGSGPVIDV